MLENLNNKVLFLYAHILRSELKNTQVTIVCLMYDQIISINCFFNIRLNGLCKKDKKKLEFIIKFTSVYPLTLYCPKYHKIKE